MDVWMGPQVEPTQMWEWIVMLATSATSTLTYLYWMFKQRCNMFTSMVGGALAGAVIFIAILIGCIFEAAE